MARTSSSGIEISAGQFSDLVKAVRDTSERVTSVGMQVAEVKGEMNAYAAGLQREQAAREALGKEVEKHDVLLRGDGTKNNPGLAAQIGDVFTVAETALAAVKQIRAWGWRISGALLVAVLVDITLRLLPHLYAVPNSAP